MPTLKILPAALDIELFKGATMDVTLVYNNLDPDTGEVIGPVDLSGWSATLTLKSMDLATQYDALSNGNGRITLGGTAGTIRFVSSATVTGAYNFDQAVLSLELTDPAGVVTPVVFGTLFIKTKP